MHKDAERGTSPEEQYVRGIGQENDSLGLSDALQHGNLGIGQDKKEDKSEKYLREIANIEDVPGDERNFKTGNPAIPDASNFTDKRDEEKEEEYS